MKHLFFLFITISSISFPNKAKAQIEKLKTGALLIRLQTNDHLINYYLKNNDLEKFKEEKENQKKKNKDIIKTFEQTWSLSNVYFFYSNYSNEIVQNDFTHVFNSKHNILNDTEKKNLKNNFLIGYIGKTTGILKFDALVLLNSNLKKMHGSLNIFVRTYKSFWVLKRRLTKTIQILEKKVKFQLSRIE